MNFSSYTGREIQHLFMIVRQFENSGIRDLEVIKIALQTEMEFRALEAKRGEIKHRLRVREAIKNIEYCPSCGGGPYITLPVNDSPATHVGGQWKAMKLCRNCYHEEWIKK